jgi:hypothetical protein
MAQTVFDVGDPITSRLNLGVTHDGTTVVTVTVTRPDGIAMSGLIISAFVGDEKTVQWYATNDGTAGAATDQAAGDWLAVWKVTGTGASVTPKVYNVAPLPGTGTRVSWSPFLSDVGDHVPFLTLDTTVPGSQVYLGTFTGNTSPTDEVAQRHIDGAVAIIGAGFETLTVPLIRMARAVAALWAAASLCRAYARDNDTRALAAALTAEARTQLKVLIEAVEGAGESALSPLPVLIAPDPVPWGDSLLIDGLAPPMTPVIIWPQ